MHNHSHAPNVWKYKRAAAEPDTRARIINKTNFAGPNGCWEWLGSRTEEGYGFLNFSFEGLQRRVLVHRLSMHLAGKPVPGDMVIDHLCRNTGCLNPEHLEVVTEAENIRRGVGYYAVNARKTHCKSGHEFTEENTTVRRVRRKGRPESWTRECRTCVRARASKKSDKTPIPAERRIP